MVALLTQSLSEDTSPHDTSSHDTSPHDNVMKFLCGMKNDILETGDTDSGLHTDIMLNVTYDDILNMRDLIFDEIERNQKREENN